MTTFEIASLIIGTLSAIFVGCSIVLLAKQLKLVIKANADNHDWNRRKASQEACYEFMRPPVVKSWNILFNTLIIKRKKYEQLSEEHQKEMRRVMNYFENLGVLIKYNIVDEDIIYDYFQSVWSLCYDATEEYISKSKMQYQDHTVFENFTTYAMKFRYNSDKLNKSRNQGRKDFSKAKNNRII
jgi:hypothetical protein